MISTTRLSDLFVEVADTLVDKFDLVEFLHHVTVNAVEISSAAAAGIMLADHDDSLRFMAASNENARLLEVFQLQHAEGPCLDAYRSGQEVADVVLDQSLQRWPSFAPRAVELGFTRAHCMPLRLRERVIGAINVFRDDGRFLDHEERRLVRAIADVATIALMQERALRRAEELTEQLQFALNSRITIEQAKGAVARARHVEVDEAFALLREHARAHRIKLTDLAGAVLQDDRLIDLLDGLPGRSSR
jgi:GAF domain-containing protein